MKNFPDYYLGLDIGSNSIGWAVTDEHYNILKFRKKLMWGSRLFDEAQTAAERRLKRCMRRRIQRRRWRLDLLDAIFAEELNRKDPNFLPIRIKGSSLQEEDRQVKGLRGLFQDASFADRDYYKRYPTIYHLRKALMEQPVQDVRLLYLAVHHLLKYRGNFLYEGEIGQGWSFAAVIRNLEEELSAFFAGKKEEGAGDLADDESLPALDFSFSEEQKKEIEEILSSSTRRTEKKEALKACLEGQPLMKANKKLEDLVAKALSGLEVSSKGSGLGPDGETVKFNFSKASYEDERPDLEAMLGERISLIDVLKQVYDYGLFANLRGSGGREEQFSISDAYIRRYEKYKADLKKTKELLKRYNREKYRALRKVKKRDIPGLIEESFKALLKQDLPAEDRATIEALITEAKEGSFLKKPRSSDNSVIPNQFHAAELKAILERQAQAFPFLTEKDEDGLTNSEKILSLCSFRIPYFVGPLNPRSPYAWCVKREGKEETRVLPWTLNEVIDLEKTGQAFIERLTNDCSYLKGEKVLPRSSLLYQEFSLLNELNKLRVNGQYLSPEWKEAIISGLFKRTKNVTVKALARFLRSQYFYDETPNIEGACDSFNASLSTWVDLLKFLPEAKVEEKREVLEEAIRLLTIHGQERSILEPALQRLLGADFSQAEIERVLRLRCAGWGRLSRKLLDELPFVNRETGEILSVMQCLREGNYNLMELMAAPFTLRDEIEKLGQKEGAEFPLSYESLVEELHLSPALKRSIWQCIKLIEEIKRVTRKGPSKIFVEVARGGDPSQAGQKTQNRKTQLQNLYASIKGEEFAELKREIARLKDDLKNEGERLSRSKRLYLYYIQLGKCMYSGEAIELNQLFSKDYDVDHIYPRSKIKDDSLDNLVLVKSQLNKDKGDGVPRPEVQNKMRGFWQSLKKAGLITAKKYEHLTTKALTPEILGGFLNRQLVSTRYTTLSLIRLLEGIYGVKPVYVRASLVSDFRREDLDYVKSRSLNDLHHAKDAYLNIVVGNVYNSLFTDNPLRWCKERKEQDADFVQHFKRRIFKWKRWDPRDRRRQIWDPEQDKERMLKFLASKNIQCTLQAYTNSGAFYNETVYAPEENPQFALKRGLPVERYGGMKSENSAYFILFEYEKKKGELQKRIDSIPQILLASGQDSSRQAREVEAYLRQKLGLAPGAELRILIRRILKNSILRIDGYNYYLVANNQDRLFLRSEPQLVLEPELERLYEQACRFAERGREAVTPADSINGVQDFDAEGLQADNWRVYQELRRKYEETLLKKRLTWGADKYTDEAGFRALSPLEQCQLIRETSHAFNRAYDSVNLMLIGGSKYAGKIGLSKDALAGKNEVLLIHKSSCGLYEQELRILG